MQVWINTILHAVSSNSPPFSWWAWAPLGPLILWVAHPHFVCSLCIRMEAWLWGNPPEAWKQSATCTTAGWRPGFGFSRAFFSGPQRGAMPYIQLDACKASLLAFLPPLCHLQASLHPGSREPPRAASLLRSEITPHCGPQAFLPSTTIDRLCSVWRFFQVF